MIDQAQLKKNPLSDADGDHDMNRDVDNDDDGDIKDAATPKAGLTDWKNPPTIRDLKQDLQDARNSHSSQETKIGGWLDNLNVSGKAKVVAPKGNSTIVPKLIRKQAEWRYAALSEPYLSTDDVFKVRPVSWPSKETRE